MIRGSSSRRCGTELSGNATVLARNEPSTIETGDQRCCKPFSEARALLPNKRETNAVVSTFPGRARDNITIAVLRASRASSSVILRAHLPPQQKGMLCYAADAVIDIVFDTLPL